MQIKISKIAMLTMPCFIALSLAACGGSSSTTTTKAVEPADSSVSPSGDAEQPNVITDNFDPKAPSKFSPRTVKTPTGVTAPIGDVVPSENGYVIIQWLDDEYGTSGSKDPSGLSLWLWPEDGCDAKITTVPTDWNSPEVVPTGKNEYGPYWKLPIDNNSVDGCNGIIVRDENINKLYGDQKISWTADDHSVTLSNKRAESYASTEEAYNDKFSASFNPENDASAHWLAKNILVWKNAENYHVRLQFDPEPIEVSDNILTGKFINLTATTLSNELKAAHPNLADFKAFEIPADAKLDDTQIKQLLKGEALLVALDGNNEVQAQTRIQTAGVIDDLYVTSALLKTELGAKVTDSGVTFKVWAPTAKEVKVHIWSANDNGGDMTEDPATGVWSYNADGLTADGTEAYKYELKVYHPATRNIETTWVTDPYSLSILWDNDGNVNSAVVDLNRDEAKPAGWDDVTAPHSQATEADISAMLITESHIRDLTVGTDKLVSAENQGKYKGLTELDSNVGKHLKDLSVAGVTHIEFLPLYDIASINEEDVFANKTLDVTLTGIEFCSRVAPSNGKTDGVDVCNSNDLVYDILAVAAADDSKDAKKVDTFLSTYVKDKDSFNWGYDPWHYQVPEGSYATDISNPYTRIKELREMFKTVKSRYDDGYGMNVILDVVYNHTDGSGLARTSVLDKIVPWYYNRLNPVTGNVISDTCCSDTAGEHKMFAKLMEDTLVTWAKDYKVDAFRFDLMGYLPKQVMVDTLANVKTRSGNNELYFFGEGWNAGSAADAMGNENNATQINMGGTGIGTYNDRIRDGVRGTGPFDHGIDVKRQGFATGRCSDTVLIEDDTHSDDGCDANAKNFQDIIRISMAGNLRDYELETYDGTIKKGSEIMYGDAIAGYGYKPIDTINYVSKHDNQTLFDMIMYKAKQGRTMEEKVKMQAIGLATVLLGQSPAFDQQGSDLLRTKYFQNDSYNTGDFSNKVNYDPTKGNEFIPGALVNSSKDSADWDVIALNRKLLY